MKNQEPIFPEFNRHNSQLNRKALFTCLFALRAACDCPKGDPHWVPPILSQQCKENGACYCPSYNGKTYTMTEKGCEEASKKVFL